MRDWKLLVDLEGQLKFPKNILTTTLRPGTLPLSEIIKETFLLHWEDCLEEDFERVLTMESRYMALDERANASSLGAPRLALARETFKWPHKQGTPGTPLNVDSTVWKDAAAAPAQAPTAPTAGLRWGAGALAARLRPT
ncbi:unnamed protein product [Pleuronectes platessa]|uniref:Uncharacterized protein n=1 Tax=Pleuronectes platessa TaxID=8262 RepID=A0A9N7VLL6_PLEPL|nr:unnamed protein product [Pleuronectes platessa]